MNLNKILHTVFFTPTPEGFWGPPLLLWSPPGMGKTAMLRALARTLGVPYERLSPGERGEGQFGVVPVPVQNATGETVLAFPPPAWAARFAEGGLIFLDEINTAPPAIQAPLLGLVQLRTLGAHTFDKRTRILAAANEVADAAGGWDLAPALANRFGHLDVALPPASAWADGFLTGWAETTSAPIDAAAEEARVMAAWPAAIARTRGVVAGFLRRNPALLHRMPARMAQETRAWPSPRTWDYVAHVLAGARIHDLDEADTMTLVQAYVGAGAATEFWAFMTVEDLHDPEDLLEGRETFVPDLTRLDRAFVALSSCLGLVLPTDAARREPRTERLWSLVDTIAAVAPDVVVSTVHALCRAKLADSRRASEVLAGFNTFARDSGLIKAAAGAN